MSNDVRSQIDSTAEKRGHDKKIVLQEKNIFTANT